MSRWRNRAPKRPQLHFQKSKRKHLHAWVTGMCSLFLSYKQQAHPGDASLKSCFMSLLSHQGLRAVLQRLIHKFSGCRTTYNWSLVRKRCHAIAFDTLPCQGTTNLRERKIDMSVLHSVVFSFHVQNFLGFFMVFRLFFSTACILSDVERAVFTACIHEYTV